MWVVLLVLVVVMVLRVVACWFVTGRRAPVESKQKEVSFCWTRLSFKCNHRIDRRITTP